MTTLGIESEPAIDVEEERRERQKKIYRIAQWMLPSLVLLFMIGGWQAPPLLLSGGVS